MKQRTRPETGPDGTESHPAFGMISIHRVSATPGEILFQSDVRHREFIRLEVHEAARKRDLKHDWVHPDRMILQVGLSMAQFASFVASSGTTGVPCTIEFAGSGTREPGHRPGLHPAPRLAVTAGEVRASAETAYSGIREALGKYEQALEDKAPAAARREALRNLRASVANAAPDVTYAARRLDEHAEEVIEKSRADIEAMVQRMTGQAGITAEVLEIGNAGGTGDRP